MLSFNTQEDIYMNAEIDEEEELGGEAEDEEEGDEVKEEEEVEDA